METVIPTRNVDIVVMLNFKLLMVEMKIDAKLKKERNKRNRTLIKLNKEREKQLKKVKKVFKLIKKGKISTLNDFVEYFYR
jgi:hypothetical protein